MPMYYTAYSIIYSKCEWSPFMHDYKRYLVANPYTVRSMKGTIFCMTPAENLTTLS